MRVLRVPVATDTFCPAPRGCGPGSEPGETQRGPSGLRGPGDGQRLSPALVPGACGQRKPRPPACETPSPVGALRRAVPLCDSRGSLPLSGQCWRQARGQRLVWVPPPPWRGPASVSRTGAGPLLNPSWGSSLLCCALGPGFGPGIPLGLGKGSSNWLMPHVTSGPPRRPLPQRHVGAAAAGEGPGVRADSGCPPTLSRQLGGADAILLGQIFPSSQIPLQPPPERQLLGWQMRWLNPPSWSLRRANRLEPTAWGGGEEAACVSARARARLRPAPALPLPFDPCLLAGGSGVLLSTLPQVQIPLT